MKKFREDLINYRMRSNRVEDDMIRGYVLKQDFIREMDVVHQKLDRILELMIKQNSK